MTRSNKLAIIFVDSNSAIEVDELFNAYSICKSVTKTPILLRDSQVKLPSQLARLIRSGDLHESITSALKSSNPMESLNSVPLDSDVLIVSTGQTQTIGNYLFGRMMTEQVDSHSWNVISSKYMRSLFVEKQRSLGEFIPTDTQIYVQSLLQRFGKGSILNALEGLEKLSVLLIGEAIFDDYILCDSLGKVSKDPLVAFWKRQHLRQFGGVLATAKHFCGLGCHTQVLSEMKENSIQSVRADLAHLKNLQISLLPGDLEIIKTRFVDRASNQRIFETYEMPSTYSNLRFIEFLEKALQESSFSRDIIIMDYGHGLIDQSLIDGLIRRGFSLTVNTQSNAGNRGFNSVARYAGAKRVFLNGSELQLEVRKKDIDVDSVVLELAQKLLIDEFFVTNGALGITGWTRDFGSVTAPAFAPIILDRIGAGDATLATIAALRSVDVHPEIALFYGNIAGAILVSSLGNEVSISTQTLREQSDRILRQVESGL